MINKFLSNKPTYKSTKEILHDINNKYEFVNLSCIGKTILERDIEAISIGNLSNPVLFVATTHAQEWLTCLLLIKFIHNISELYKNNLKFNNIIDLRKEFLNNGVIIVPLVNPDGLEIAINGSISAKHLKYSVKSIMDNSDKLWQANANGVDINHNFDAGFDILKKIEKENNIISPSPTQYGGLYPESENETKSLVNLCKNYNIKRLLTFHSQGEEIYYKYGNNTPYSSYILANLFSKSSKYKLIENDGLASHGGFKDWFIDKLYKPGFTIEIGKGKNPLPIEDLDSIYNNLSYMMIISIIL